MPGIRLGMTEEAFLYHNATTDKAAVKL